MPMLKTDGYGTASLSNLSPVQGSIFGEIISSKMGYTALWQTGLNIQVRITSG